MEEQLTQITEQLVKVAGALGGALLAILKTRDALMRLSNSKPLLRRAITADLELLRLMKESDPAYQPLQAHITRQVKKMIEEEGEAEFLAAIRRRLEAIFSRNWGQVIFGLLMAGGFGYWTYAIVTGPTSNWWTILTGWMALAGIGFLFGATSERPRDNATTAAHPPIAQASEADAGSQPTTTGSPPA